MAEEENQTESHHETAEGLRVDVLKKIPLGRMGNQSFSITSQQEINRQSE